MFKTKNSPGKKKAFTIVELVIVIAVIAILMGILFIGGTAISNNAKKSTLSSDLRSYEVDLKAYVNDPKNHELKSDVSLDAATAMSAAESLLNNYLEDEMMLKKADGAKTAFTAVSNASAAKMPGGKGSNEPLSWHATTNQLDPYGMPYQMVFLNDSTEEHTDLAFLVISYGKNKQTDKTNGLGTVLDADDVALVIRITDSVIYSGTYESEATSSYWKAVTTAASVAGTTAATDGLNAEKAA